MVSSPPALARLRPPHAFGRQALRARRRKKSSNNTRQEDVREGLLEDVPGVDLGWPARNQMAVDLRWILILEHA
jgi:hypothetical protein